jgi:hypothetical protein
VDFWAFKRLAVSCASLAIGASLLIDHSCSVLRRPHGATSMSVVP